MLQLLLSEKSRRGGDLPPLEYHDNVELLLENYHRQIIDISQQAFYLRKNLQSTSQLMNVGLDSYRNKLMRINLHLSMGMMGLGGGTLVAGLFGKFKRSYHREHRVESKKVYSTESMPNEARHLY